MAKRFMLIDPSKERQPKKQKKAITDWKLCIISQEATTERTVCPAKSADPGIGYKTLAEDVELFQENGCLPVHISFSRFDEGSGHGAGADLDRVDRVPEPCQRFQIYQITWFEI